MFELSRSLSVLLVDDDEFVRGVIPRMLAEVGITSTHVAESAETALQIASRERDLDIVISDLEMPGVDGLEFLRRLSEQHPRAAVLIFSAKGPDILRSVELMARAYGLTVLGVLPKPATIAALRDIVNRYRPVATGTPTAPPGVTVDKVRQAVERREFVLAYQPRVELASRRPIGVEALVRWDIPGSGLLSPGHFLSMVEDQGLMNALTFDLLDKAIGTLRGWLTKDLDLSVSVNVSQSSLDDTSFSSRVLDICSRHDVSPARLTVEITETVAMTNVAHALETLARLRMHGVGLAIDDFGTGHSSFQQLSRLPCTELKIDRSFVTGATRQTRLRTIVESHIGLARALGLACAGEGVESAEDWQLLAALGCDIAQGYFIAAPMAPDRIPTWIADWGVAPV